MLVDTKAESTPTPAAQPVKRASTIALFVFVVLAWSLNWVVMKMAVHDVPPLWAVTMRTGLAAAVLFPVLYAKGLLKVPARTDYPIVLVIALFHMVAFAALMTVSLTYVSAGRAIVLGYTTPLWVAPAAYFFLKETMTARQVVGSGVSVLGLLLLVGPIGQGWNAGHSVLGQVLPIMAAVSWSVSIVYTRAHRWKSTPLLLMPWQCLLATAVLGGLAFFLEGAPPFKIAPVALLALIFNGVVGTALGFWAMTVVNRRVPAGTAALGVLATPVLGIGFAALILGEGFDGVLLCSSALILFGVIVGTSARGRQS